MIHSQEERITAIETAPKETFLETVEKMLKESGNDPETTNSQHEDLFRAFSEKVTILFPDPMDAEKRMIRKIRVSLFSKEDIFKSEAA